MQKNYFERVKGVYELTKSFSEAESELISNELQRLYDAQDKTLRKEQRVTLVEELGRSGIPASAVLAGIRRLVTEDIDRIKLATLLASARSTMVAADEVVDGRVYCAHCHGSGHVSMRDDQRRAFSLRCKCSAGARPGSRGLVLWNGRRTQESNGRTLTLEYDSLPKDAPE